MDGAGLPASGRIGPNAVHQLVAVLDRREGPARRAAICGAAGIVPPPPDAGMWPEAEAAALHRAVRQRLPDRAEAILREAGTATGDYILAHRIPRPAQWALRALPGGIAARLLSRAIAAHAWTFAGSGAFRIAGAGRPPAPSLPHEGGGRRPAPALVLEIAGNPLIAGERAERPLCAWHAAVFERLYSRLAWPGAAVEELSCAARGDPCCRFAIRPRGIRSQGHRGA